jgi:hypothetical protein
MASKRVGPKPGDRISWTDVALGGGELTPRTGQVWALAPMGALWVIPEVPLPGEPSAVAVSPSLVGHVVPVGEWFSCVATTTTPGQAMAHARDLKRGAERGYRWAIDEIREAG